MDDHKSIDAKMRSILVDWLITVHRKMKLAPETLYLTVNIIDQYLARREVLRSQLQLVGISAFLIASKYEDIYFPELCDLVFVCDDAYTKEDVSSIGHALLYLLQYAQLLSSALTDPRSGGEHS